VSINPSPPQYKGADLDPARGPGLGCFWLQVVILATFVILTPIGVLNGWPVELTVGMLVVVLVLLFFVGQTAIFLLRLVAAERRGRRRPLASPTRTVGELEDASGRESGESSEPREPGASGESGERPTKRGRS
jgi:hypothetical protein